MAINFDALLQNCHNNLGGDTQVVLSAESGHDDLSNDFICLDQVPGIGGEDD